MPFSQRALLLYPAAGLSAAMMDAVAQAYVTHLGLETFANERLMFTKAASTSTDYGATTTHRQITSAMTPELASAIKTALSGMAGNWYLLDAGTGELLDTNDATKAAHGLDWEPGATYAAGEVVAYQGQLYSVIEAHVSQADWLPDICFSLFKRYTAPGEISEWRQPLSSVDAYPVGARVKYANKMWLNVTPANVWVPGTGALWTNETPPPTTTEWVSGEQGLKVGDQRTYQGVTYRVVQNPGINIWTPPTVPALWQPV